MNDIQSRALTRAKNLLASIGARYVIVDADQKQYVRGGLKVVGASGIHRKPKQFKHARKYRYTEKLETAKPGDLVQYVCDTQDEAESLRGTLAATCVRLYGAGSSMTSVTKNDAGKFVVELLMIGEPVADPELDQALETTDA